MDIFEKYEIPRDISLDTLVIMREKYVTLVESAKASVESSEGEVSSKLTELKKDEALVEKVESMKVQLLDSIYSTVGEDDERAFVLIYEVMKDLASLFKFERDCFLRAEKVKNTPAKSETDDDFDEKKKDAEELAEKIRALFSGLLTMMPDLFMDKKGKKKEIEGFPLKMSEPRKDKATGEVKKDHKSKVLPDLPKVPFTRGSVEGQTRGRKVTGSQLTLIFNDEQVFPSEKCATPHEVAQKVLTDRKTGVHYTWKSVLDSVKDMGKNIMTDEWELKLITGTLKGFPQKNEEATTE